MIALGSGQEDQTGGLVFDQSADAGALFLGELLGVDTDVAEDDDIVFCEVLDFFRKLVDVIRSAAHAELRVEQQAGKLHAGIAGQRIAQEAVFPARQGLHDEHADFFRFARDGELAAVVQRHQFSLGRRKGQVECRGTFLFQLPEDGVIGGFVGRQGQGFGALAAGVVAQADGGADLAVEGAADGEGDLYVFADDAIGRGIDGEQVEVGQAFFRSRRDGEQGDFAEQEFLCGGNRRLTEVPVAV